MHCLLDGGEGTQNQRAQRRADKLLSNHVGWGCSPPRGEETRWKVCAGAAVTAATKRATGPPSCYPAAHHSTTEQEGELSPRGAPGSL